MIGLTLTRPGMASQVAVWQGRAGCGKACYGPAWLGKTGAVPQQVADVLRGGAWQGKGSARCGKASLATAGLGRGSTLTRVAAGPGTARRGMARLGRVGRGTARLGVR